MADVAVLDHAYRFTMQRFVATGQAPHYTELAAELGANMEEGKQHLHDLINSGIPAIICDADQIDDGDELEVRLTEGKVIDHTKGTALEFDRLPDIMQRILADGGLAEHIKKHGDFALGE